MRNWHFWSVVILLYQVIFSQLFLHDIKIIQNIIFFQIPDHLNAHLINNILMSDVITDIFSNLFTRLIFSSKMWLLHRTFFVLLHMFNSRLLFLLLIFQVASGHNNLTWTRQITHVPIFFHKTEHMQLPLIITNHQVFLKVLLCWIMWPNNLHTYAYPLMLFVLTTLLPLTIVTSFLKDYAPVYETYYYFVTDR